MYGGMKTQLTHAPHLAGTARNRSRALLSAAVGAAAVVALVAGCASDDDDDPTGTTTAAASAPSMIETSRSEQPKVSTTDADALVKQSAQTTRLMQSAHVELKVDDKVMGLPVREVKGDLTSNPAPKAQGEGKFRINNNDTEVAFIVSDGQLYIKKDGDSEYTSIGEASKVYDPAIILDREQGLAKIIETLKGFKLDGSETVNGVAAKKVTGTVPAAVLDKVFPTQGDGKFSGDIPVTLYIADAAPYNLVKVNIKVKTGDINLTTSDWQKKVDIQAP